jgi:hypothetical protein
MVDVRHHIIDGQRITHRIADVFIGGASGSFSSLTADRTLTVSDNGITINNTGANGTVIATLPASAGITAGWKARARVTAAYILRLKAQGTDTIRFDSIEGVAAGCLQAAELGACLELEYQGAGKFYVTAPPMGLWSDNT